MSVSQMSISMLYSRMSIGLSHSHMSSSTMPVSKMSVGQMVFDQMTCTAFSTPLRYKKLIIPLRITFL